MAEGDVIHRVAHRFDETMVGDEVTASVPGARGPEGRSARDLDGRRLIEASARGKHLVLTFEGDVCVHSHLGMWGAWHLQPIGKRWRKPRHRAWLALRSERWEAVNFGGSTLRIVGTGELGGDRRLASLGPDVLAPDFDPAECAQRLARFGAGRELGEALLDQAIVAGIGNIFKSEGCFAAELSPWRPVDGLEVGEASAVLERAAEQMTESVRSGRRPGAVYRRAGRPCHRCRRGTRIRSAKQGDDARTTYWCPRCQRAESAGPG